MILDILYDLVDPESISTTVKSNMQGTLNSALFNTPSYVYCAYHLNMTEDQYILNFMNYTESLLAGVYPDQLRQELTDSVIAEAEYMQEHSDIKELTQILRKIKNNCCFLKKS